MVAADMTNCFRRCLKVLISAGLPSVMMIASSLTAQERRNYEDPFPRAGIYQDDAVPEPLRLPNEAATGADYVIGPEDILKIDVFEVRELSKLEVRVAYDGTIIVPLLGSVKVAGLTAKQLSRELETKWGETYLENPQISVFIQEFRSRPVAVVGAVEKPGLYPLAGPRNLIEMLSIAGGLSKRGSAAAGRTVIITRKGGFEGLQPVTGLRRVGPDKVEIDLKSLFFSTDGALNLQIEPSDIISVSKADIVYVVGDVKKPGGFLMEDRESLTVLQVLALAEGLNWTASRSGGQIIRRNSDGSRKEIPVDLGKILKGKDKDIELAANDILFVPMSKSKAGGRRTVDAVVGTISGLLIYGRF